MLSSRVDQVANDEVRMDGSTDFLRDYFGATFPEAIFQEIRQLNRI